MDVVAPGEMAITFSLIKQTDDLEFYKMAVRHFTGLNPKFVPKPEWKKHYFRSIISDNKIYAYWILVSGQPAGFFIYLLEQHPFYERVDGVIREVYVEPEYRRMGLATKSIAFVVDKMNNLGIERIFVDMIHGDKRAENLWVKNSFLPFTQRHKLRKNE